MNKLSILLVTSVFAFAAAAGCSSDDDSSGGGTGGSTGSGGKGGSGGSSAKGGSGGSGSGGSGSGGVGVGSGGAGASDAGDAAGEAGDDASSDGSTDVPSSGDVPAGEVSAAANMSFFVTSDTSKTGKLGGLTGADKRCADLAAAVGSTGKTWVAYLSAETAGPGGAAVNAKDRIGTGPWFNSKGVMVAATLTELHTRKGDYKVFIDEKGNYINGQWVGSPKPNEHDILTGSKVDGTVSPGETCTDWTGTTGNSRVGHTDGLGPNQDTTGGKDIWNSVHTGSCADTAPGGGAGRLYCFAK
jgi:hypothetical protein